jgi:hypothetical protein
LSCINQRLVEIGQWLMQAKEELVLEGLDFATVNIQLGHAEEIQWTPLVLLSCMLAGTEEGVARNMEVLPLLQNLQSAAAAISLRSWWGVHQ